MGSLQFCASMGKYVQASTHPHEGSRNAFPPLSLHHCHAANMRIQAGGATKDVASIRTHPHESSRNALPSVSLHHCHAANMHIQAGGATKDVAS
eukprot:925391-Pelagomonas_calceolata.AAC.1